MAELQCGVLVKRRNNSCTWWIAFAQCSRNFRTFIKRNHT